MLRLEDRDWKAFMISDLFTIERGNYGKRPEFVKDGACPFMVHPQRITE